MIYKISLTIFILTTYYSAYSDAFDISMDSILPKKTIKCYECSSLKVDECKNSTAVKQEKFIKECPSNAKGCVKQWLQTPHGKTAIFRQCYFGSINSIYTDFDCDDETMGDRNKRYDVVECYKCKGSLCNNSNRLIISRTEIFIYSLFLIAIKFILSL
ncbi:UPAR/Ly6 domain-containing protein bero-like [Cochliomyia hominivorax]